MFCIILALLISLSPARAAVELVSFAIVAGDQELTLQWVTATEINNDHFDILRDSVLVARIAGAGTSFSEVSYGWTDDGLENGTTYAYILTAVDIDGYGEIIATGSATPTALSVPDRSPSLAEQIELSVFPNPFNSATTLSFMLPQASPVRISVCDVTGRQVSVIVDAWMPAASRYQFAFDAATLPTGLYMAVMETRGYRLVQRLMLLK